MLTTEQQAELLAAAREGNVQLQNASDQYVLAIALLAKCAKDDVVQAEDLGDHECADELADEYELENEIGRPNNPECIAYAYLRAAMG